MRARCKLLLCFFATSVAPGGERVVVAVVVVVVVVVAVLAVVAVVA